MVTKVIYEGDDIMLEYPIVLEKDNWVIPRCWYLLENEMENRPSVVYTKDKKPIIVIEHVQILYQHENVDYRLSVIKTDKLLKKDDEIYYK